MLLLRHHPRYCPLCVPRQQFSHLPCRARYALLPGPVTFNRIISMNMRALHLDIRKVLDITCPHTDLGMGRHLLSFRGPAILALVYLA